jgi:hypothetical protein
MAKWALAYAANNFKVIPLWPFRGVGDAAVCCCPQTPDKRCPAKPGKHPHTLNSIDDASSDSSVIRRWWVQWPDAGIGLALGPNGLSVIDIDPQNKGSLESLEQQFGPLDETLIQLSGRGNGSQHILYRAPDESLGTPISKPAVGVDFLHGNRFIVAAPSRHSATGKFYSWASDQNPATVHRDKLLQLLSDPPDWLFPNRDKAKPKKQKVVSMPAADRVPVDRILAPALEKLRSGEDTRNNTGLWFFAQLRDNGYTRDEASLSLREWVRLANEAMPGQDKYTQREAEATLRSAYNRDAREPWEEDDGKESQADILLKLIPDFEYFKSGPNNDCFVRMVIDGHKEVWKVDAKSPKVREVLTHRYLTEKDRAPSREALNTVIDTIAAKCSMGPKVDVHVRFARSREAIYLDMCDDQWRAIEVTAKGWRVVTDVPVLFRRGVGARSLPVPVEGGSLDALRPLINSGDDTQWCLILAWLVGAFLPDGAFSHLALNGEQGSAKSTTALVLQSLIDPSDAGLCGPPRDEVDCTVSALNAGVLFYDNLSGIKADLADVFCRLSTGQGFQTRTFYENLGITMASAKVPVALNGINETIMRGDLLERSIVVKLPRVTPDTRLTEAGIWANFAKVQPGCLGALLDAVATGLRNLPNTTLKDPPRMSDFCTWIVSCEESLPWNPGQFLAAYRGKQEDAYADLAEGDSVSAALLEWALKNTTPDYGSVVVTAKDLLVALNDLTEEEEIPKDFKSWPASPESLAHRLVRLAPVLRSQGVDLRRLPRTAEVRSRWEVRRVPVPGTQLSLIAKRIIADSQEEVA